MNDTMINELLEKGYEEWPESPFDADVSRIFQKKFEDGLGTKYFITVYIFRSLTHPHTHEEIIIDPEFNIQLYSSNGYKPLNLKFFSGWTIDEVEQYVQDIFSITHRVENIAGFEEDVDSFEYYEKY